MVDVGGKMPPQAVDLEEAVLGAVLISKEAFDRVSFLKPEHFYKEDHELIFDACVSLNHENKPIDLLTVVDKLKKNGNLERVGGEYKVFQLGSKVANHANIE